MKKKLVLISSFIVFLIQTVSMLIVGTISTILIHSGIITINGSSKTRVIMVICCILGASILIGFNNIHKDTCEAVGRAYKGYGQACRWRLFCEN